MPAGRPRSRQGHAVFVQLQEDGGHAGPVEQVLRGGDPVLDAADVAPGGGGGLGPVGQQAVGPPVARVVGAAGGVDQDRDAPLQRGQQHGRHEARRADALGVVGHEYHVALG